MPTFITPEVQAKRAANLKETGKKMETLRRNEISRFLKEGIPVLCQKTRKEAISEYLITGKLPDKICIYDHDLLITSAVANNSECRKELLKELQSLEERVCSIKFSYTESSPWVATTDPYIVGYFSNNQE